MPQMFDDETHVSRVMAFSTALKPEELSRDLGKKSKKKRGRPSQLAGRREDQGPGERTRVATVHGLEIHNSTVITMV